MKKILLLATGGTIASRPTAAGGLAPAITSEELLACVPELADLCEVSAVQVFNLDSTNVGPAQWQIIVRCIKEIMMPATALSSPTARIRCPTRRPRSRILSRKTKARCFNGCAEIHRGAGRRRAAQFV